MKRELTPLVSAVLVPPVNIRVPPLSEAEKNAARRNIMAHVPGGAKAKAAVLQALGLIPYNQEVQNG